MNILDLENMVKGMPDQALQQQARQPTGQIPQFLLVSEVQRRTKMRRDHAAMQNKADMPTVTDQILNQGIGAVGPPPPRQAGPGPAGPGPAGPPVRMYQGGTAPIVQGGMQYTPEQLAQIKHEWTTLQRYHDAPDPDDQVPLDPTAPVVPTPPPSPQPMAGPIAPINMPTEGIAALAAPQSEQKAPEAPDPQVQAVNTDVSVQAKGPPTLLDQVGRTVTTPDFSDLVEAERQAGISNALIQLGAGVAGSRWGLSRGLSAAGQALTESQQVQRELEVAQRVGETRAESEAIQRDIYALVSAGQVQQTSDALAREAIKQGELNRREVFNTAAQMVDAAMEGTAVIDPQKRAQMVWQLYEDMVQRVAQQMGVVVGDIAQPKGMSSNVQLTDEELRAKYGID